MLKDLGRDGGGFVYPFESICSADSPWMSNLFVNLARTSSPTTSRLLYNARPTHHKAVNADLFLAWYVLLGGHVEEETLWAVDKSYVLPPSSIL